MQNVSFFFRTLFDAKKGYMYQIKYFEIKPAKSQFSKRKSFQILIKSLQIFNLFPYLCALNFLGNKIFYRKMLFVISFGI